jgi:hypothetical protein
LAPYLRSIVVSFPSQALGPVASGKPARQFLISESLLRSLTLFTTEGWFTTEAGENS